jgi:signal transduction histidine kinase
MGKWFKARWKAYLDTSDPDVAMSGSTPGQVAFVVLVLTTIYLSCQHVPLLQELTGMRRAGGAVALTLVGAAITFVAHRHRCRGTIGSMATLFDVSCYSASIAFAAMNMKGTAALSMAAFYGVSLMFPAQLYALTLLFAVSMSLPVLGMLMTFRPPLPVAFVLVVSTIAMLTFSSTTGHRRAAARRERQLEEALDAAGKVADESIQAALTTTLLTLGHFLHELRNYQTSISGNLEYLGINAPLTPATREALAEARQAQKQEEELVRATIDDLRARSRPAQTSFLLSTALARAKTNTFGISVQVDKEEVDLEMFGNPEHLGVVLLNLIRNAEQAGASLVRISCKPEPSGHAAQVLVQDNGPGLDRGQQEHLFDTFALSTKPGGSGLGLYLVRRYVELLGGRIEAQSGAMGGAAFALRLPGKVRHVSGTTQADERHAASAE